MPIKNKQKKRKKGALFLAFLVITFIAFASQADAAFDYKLLEQFPGFFSAGSSPSFPDLLSAIYKFGIWTVGIAAFFMLSVGGFLYATSAGNTSSINTAKNIITDALIGLVAAFAAYLLLYVINPDLVNLNLNLVSVNISGTSGGPPGGVYTSPGSSPGSGQCLQVPSGECSVASLSRYFGRNALSASLICNVESRGNPVTASKSDICRNDPRRRPFSWGLFQINLTQHSIGGLNCPSAFEGKNYNCRIVKEDLYYQCVRAAQNPKLNIQKAVSLSGDGRNWVPWRNSKNKCGL